MSEEKEKMGDLEKGGIDKRGKLGFGFIFSLFKVAMGTWVYSGF